MTEIENYKKYLTIARDTGIWTHFKTALTIAFFFFGMFGYYAYAYYIGTILITKPVENVNSYKY